MSTIDLHSHSFLETQEAQLCDLQRVVKSSPDSNFETLIGIEQSIQALKDEAKDCREEDLAGIMFQLNQQHTHLLRGSLHLLIYLI